MAAIEVRDLYKRYGETQALAGVSFTVEVGEVFALLGPNGAGKSTAVEILEGHRTPTSGRATVLGVDPQTGGRTYRDRIGVVLQTSGIERELTVVEAIEEYRAVYRAPRPVDEVLDLAGLTEKADARVKTLSGGQQRRIDLALGIVGDPEVLFLDEPTTGFDPAARRRSWELIERLRSLGTTILLTTHYMDEAQHLADRLAVIANGRIVREGTVEELGRDNRTNITFRLPAGHDVATLPVGARTEAGVVRIVTAEPTRVMHDLTAWALDRGIELDELTVARPSLEDVYLQLVGDPQVEAPR